MQLSPLDLIAIILVVFLNEFMQLILKKNVKIAFF